MKRYIKASTAIVGGSSEELKTQLLGIQKDFKSLARCETLEDVNNAQWSYWRIDNLINHAVSKQGKSVEEAIDDMLDSLHEDIQKLKLDIQEKIEYEQKSNELMIYLEHLDGEYDLVSNDGQVMLFNAPEGATHRDCIAFVDDVVSAIEGRYYGTGRGGSWTAWDILSKDGIYLKAGWRGNDQWFIELQ